MTKLRATLLLLKLAAFCCYSNAQDFEVMRDEATLTCVIKPLSDRSSDGDSNIILSRELQESLKEYCGDLRQVLASSETLTKAVLETAERRITRSKRQLPGAVPRKRFRGQTQTQYIAFNSGNQSEKSGTAEAVATPEVSRATVSGVQGMGQAQSQIGIDDPCDELCGGSRPQGSVTRPGSYGSRPGDYGSADYPGPGRGPYPGQTRPDYGETYPTGTETGRRPGSLYSGSPSSPQQPDYNNQGSSRFSPQGPGRYPTGTAIGGSQPTAGESGPSRGIFPPGGYSEIPGTTGTTTGSHGVAGAHPTSGGTYPIPGGRYPLSGGTAGDRGDTTGQYPHGGQPFQRPGFGSAGGYPGGTSATTGQYPAAGTEAGSQQPGQYPAGTGSDGMRGQYPDGKELPLGRPGGIGQPGGSGTMGQQPGPQVSQSGGLGSGQPTGISYPHAGEGIQPTGSGIGYLGGLGGLGPGGIGQPGGSGTMGQQPGPQVSQSGGLGSGQPTGIGYPHAGEGIQPTGSGIGYLGGKGTPTTQGKDTPRQPIHVPSDQYPEQFPGINQQSISPVDGPGDSSRGQYPGGGVQTVGSGADSRGSTTGETSGFGHPGQYPPTGVHPLTTGIGGIPAVGSPGQYSDRGQFGPTTGGTPEMGFGREGSQPSRPGSSGPVFRGGPGESTPSQGQYPPGGYTHGPGGYPGAGTQGQYPERGSQPIGTGLSGPGFRGGPGGSTPFPGQYPPGGYSHGPGGISGGGAHGQYPDQGSQPFGPGSTGHGISGAPGTSHPGQYPGAGIQPYGHGQIRPGMGESQPVGPSLTGSGLGGVPGAGVPGQFPGTGSYGPGFGTTGVGRYPGPGIGDSRDTGYSSQYPGVGAQPYGPSSSGLGPGRAPGSGSSGQYPGGALYTPGSIGGGIKGTPGATYPGLHPGSSGKGIGSSPIGGIPGQYSRDGSQAIGPGGFPQASHPGQPPAGFGTTAGGLDASGQYPGIGPPSRGDIPAPYLPSAQNPTIGLPGQYPTQVGSSGGVGTGQYTGAGAGSTGQYPGTGVGFPGQHPSNGAGFPGQYPSSAGGFPGQYPSSEVGVPGLYPGTGLGISGQYPSTGQGIPGQYPSTGGGAPGVGISLPGQYPGGGVGSTGQYPGERGGPSSQVPRGSGAEYGVSIPGNQTLPGTGVQCPTVDCATGEGVDGETQALSSVHYEGNETKAQASSQGKVGSGLAQTQVSGTYTGGGAFSAQAQTSDSVKSSQSQIQGSSKGATSTAQGKAGKAQTQAQVQVAMETGATQAESQTNGETFGTNTQVNAGTEGGMADAQSKGPGSTSSQAQIGFLPYDGSNDNQKTPFRGGGTASAQSSGISGQSQSQIQGTFKYGISYTGAAQAGSGATKDVVFPKLSLPGSLYNTSNVVRKNHTSAARNEASLVEDKSKTSVVNGSQSKRDGRTNSTPSSPPGNTFGSRDSNQDLEHDYEDDDYEESEEEDESVPPMLSTRSGGHSFPLPPTTTTTTSTTIRPTVQIRQSVVPTQTQQIILAQDNRHDTLVIQDSALKHGDVFKAGEEVPGSGGYRVPSGFRGRVTSVAGDTTEVSAPEGGHAQSQTVLISPGSGRLQVTNPSTSRRQESLTTRESYRRFSKPEVYSPPKYTFSSGLNSLGQQEKPYDSFVTVTNSETGQLKTNSREPEKKYAHTYYTKSSTCGYFTFTCTAVSGSNGRTKICKPRPQTNPDGTPCF